MDHFTDYAAAGNACLAAEEQAEREAARIGATLDEAWRDANKLADACDTERVQDWLRITRSASDNTLRAAAAANLIDAIDAALMSDPMFDIWILETAQDGRSLPE
ncbi:MAG: hypothetical protein KGJ21_09935 [Pseudomonadota bacterium]|nr:hypothetical protein [Pseudomonadota bacterium]